MNAVRIHLKHVVDERVRPAFTSRVMAKFVESQAHSLTLRVHPMVTLLATLLVCVALTELHARLGQPTHQVLEAPWIDLIAVAHQWRLHL